MGNVVYLRPYRSEYQPISALNITPLIDVMLVLLVMLILCLPMATHQVTVDLPTPTPPIAKREAVVQNLLLTGSGTALWNGQPISDADLDRQLRDAALAKDELRFQTQGHARYERFNELIAMTKRAGIAKIGFVGNAQFADWSK